MPSGSSPPPSDPAHLAFQVGLEVEVVPAGAGGPLEAWRAWRVHTVVRVVVQRAVVGEVGQVGDLGEHDMVHPDNHPIDGDAPTSMTPMSVSGGLPLTIQRYR